MAGDGLRHGASWETYLFKFPPIGHSGDHLRKLLLLALQDSVHVLHGALRSSVLIVPYPFLNQPHKRCNVVKLRFFQNTFFCQLLRNDELPMAEVV